MRSLAMATSRITLRSYHTEAPPRASDERVMPAVRFPGSRLDMGKSKSKGAKFAAVKKIISKKTIRKYKEDVLNPKTKDEKKEKLRWNVLQISSALFFSYNTALGPPCRMIVDTNFINFSIQNKE